ncbi:MAG: GNAT family N-acetyltransferase [Planctomycetota bacterium]
MTTIDHGALTIRTYVPGDEHAILQTFNRVFREQCGEGYVDRDVAFWRWQFRDNPAGTQILLAVAADGTVAAQYTAVPQTADTVHGPKRFVHVVDSMTHPDFRQGLKQQGLFATLGNRFTEDYREHGNEIGYGFPVRMAERIGRRLLDYSLLRTVDYWLRDPQLDLPSAPANVAVASLGLELPAELDALWQLALPESPFAVRKDRRYLQWRYASGPEAHRYMRLGAYRHGELVGFLALRVEHELIPSACTIADLVCGDDDEGAARALLAEACRLAAERSRTLLAVFADHDPNRRRLADIGCHQRSSAHWHERRLTHRITGPDTSPEQLADLWRYSLGDTDLC